MNRWMLLDIGVLGFFLLHLIVRVYFESLMMRPYIRVCVDFKNPRLVGLKPFHGDCILWHKNCIVCWNCGLVLNCVLFWFLGEDVFPHCAGAKHAASPSPLWSRPSRKACFKAHERRRGNLQVLILKTNALQTIPP